MGKNDSFTKLFHEFETDALHKSQFRGTIPRTWPHAYWNCRSKDGSNASGSWPSTTMWLRPTHHMFEIWILADVFLVPPHSTTRKSERKNAARVTKGWCHNIVLHGHSHSTIPSWTSIREFDTHGEVAISLNDEQSGWYYNNYHPKHRCRLSAIPLNDGYCCAYSNNCHWKHRCR